MKYIFKFMGKKFCPCKTQNFSARYNSSSNIAFFKQDVYIVLFNPLSSNIFKIVDFPLPSIPNKMTNLPLI